MTEGLQTCGACGAETAPGAAYCQRCGARLEGRSSDRPADGGRTAGAADSGGEATGEAPGTGGAGAGDRVGDAPGETAGDSSKGAPGEGAGLGPRADYELRIGDWMSRGWTVFTRAGGLFLGFAAIHWLLLHFATPVWLILSPMLTAGFFVAALNVRRGRPLQFSDFWLGFNDALPLFLCWLVSLALMLAGLCTCGILTIYLWVAYQFAYLLIVDGGMDFWDALEASRKTVNRNWFGMFALAVLVLLLNLVAYLVTFSLGLIVSIPFTACVIVEAYADIFGVRGRTPGRGTAQGPGPGEAPAPVSGSSAA